MVQEGREHRCCNTFLAAVGQSLSIFQERGHTHSSWPWKKYWGIWGRFKNGRISFEGSLTRVASDPVSGISPQLTRTYYAEFVFLNLVCSLAPLQGMPNYSRAWIPHPRIPHPLDFVLDSRIECFKTLGARVSASCQLHTSSLAPVGSSDSVVQKWDSQIPPVAKVGRYAYSEADAEVLSIGAFCLVDERAAVVNKKLWWTLKSVPEGERAGRAVPSRLPVDDAWYSAVTQLSLIH